MSPGSVIVDVAVDQGGCIETCRPTTHDHPTYEVHGVVHYCVPNMPGAVPQTSTWALTNVTIPYAVKIADHGLRGGGPRRRRAPPGRQHATAATSRTSPSRGRTGLDYVPARDLLR